MKMEIKRRKNVIIASFLIALFILGTILIVIEHYSHTIALLLIVPCIFIIYLVIKDNYAYYKELLKLKNNGLLIDADYKEVNTIIFPNADKVRYSIVCTWTNPDDGKLYTFSSTRIYFNPEEYIKKNNINKFMVYIDRENINNYCVDIDNIKK